MQAQDITRFRLLPTRGRECSGHRDVRPLVDELGHLTAPYATLPEACLAEPAPYFDYVGEQLRQFWAAPRHLEIALAYLAEYLPFQRFAIYPGGALAQAFLQQADSRVKERMVCVLDRAAKADSQWQGLTSIRPEQLLDEQWLQRVEGVLVLHPTREPLLRQNLADLGIADTQVRGVFTEPEFLAWWQIHKEKWLQPQWLGCLEQGALPPAQVKHVIVTTNPGISIIQQAELTQLFPVAETQVLYLGNPNFFAGMKTPYPCLNLFCSQDALRYCIEFFQPESIHVASVHADNYLAMLVKQAFAHLPISHEIYDWSLFYSNHFVEPLHSATSALVDAGRIGELYSLRHLPLLLSKRDGKAWRAILQEGQAQASYQVYFHNFTLHPVSQPVRKGGKPRLVYAGPVAPLKRPEEWPIYEFGPLLAMLAEDARVHFEVYNSLHPNEREDELFSEEMRIFAPGYHRCQPLAELLPQLASFDYGWMCLNTLDYLRRCPDVNLVHSARLIGYITAGIPVIVDRTWRAAVELVERFNAGMVIDLDACSPQQLVEHVLQGWQPDVHRQGALALREHMRQTNANTLAQLSHFHLNGLGGCQ